MRPIMTTREKVAIVLRRVLQSSRSVCYAIQDEDSGTEWLIAVSRWEQSAWLSAYCGYVGFAIKVGDQDVNHLADAVTEQIRITTSYWKEEGKCRQELP